MATAELRGLVTFEVVFTDLISVERAPAGAGGKQPMFDLRIRQEVWSISFTSELRHCNRFNAEDAEWAQRPRRNAGTAMTQRARRYSLLLVFLDSLFP
jgi:hypothetical protein